MKTKLVIKPRTLEIAYVDIVDAPESIRDRLNGSLDEYDNYGTEAEPLVIYDMFMYPVDAIQELIQELFEFEEDTLTTAQIQELKDFFKQLETSKVEYLTR